MAKEIIKVEAQICIALLHQVIRPPGTIEQILQEFRIHKACQRLAAQRCFLCIQAFPIVEHVIGCDIRHHIGQRGDRKEDIVLVYIHLNPVFREVERNRLSRILEFHIGDSHK